MFAQLWLPAGCGLSWIRILVLSHSSPSHLTVGLLQCTLLRVTLKKHSEATAGAVCSSTGSLRGSKGAPCNTTSLWAAGLLLVQFKVLVITIKAHDMGSGYLRKPLIPLGLPPPDLCWQRGHAVGPAGQGIPATRGPGEDSSVPLHLPFRTSCPLE